MDKKMKNEELQTRREFFKKAAKGVLPMLGVFAFGPTILTSCRDSKSDGCDACSIGCSDACYKTCTGSASGTSCSDCSSSCSGNSTSDSCSNCANTCSSSCKETCQTTCKETCSTTCEGSATGKPVISDASGNINGYEYVDLGLSVKWARYNLGTSKPEGFGLYISYADPTGDNVYNETSADNYYLRDNWNTFYNFFRTNGNNTICGTQYDCATNKWGNKWRLPSIKEFKELTDNCDIEAYSYNGVDGIRLTSKKNGNSIFFPAAGGKSYCVSLKLQDKGKKGYYWSGDLGYFGNSGPYAKHWAFNYPKANTYDSTDDMGSQLSVRPVTTGSESSSGCTGSSCSSNCANNSTGSSCSSCGSGCSSGCKDSCSGNCANTCRTGCGGRCNTSCGGTCTYLSKGSSCSGCATTCYNQCYTSCTLACSDSCQSSCVYGSK